MSQAQTGKLSFEFQTHPGKKKLKNEDSVIADSELNLFIVCDGASEPPGGEIAADLASRAFQAYLKKQSLPDQKELAKWPKIKIQLLMASALQYADKKVREQHQKTYGIATTLTAAWVIDTKLFYIHVGDSRLYCFRGGKLYPQLTKDHSVNNVLHGAVGASLLPAQQGIIELRDSDTFLLCTDGLNKELIDSDIETVLKQGNQLRPKVEALMKSSLSKKASDNISFVLLSYAAPSVSIEEGTQVSVDHKVSLLKRLEFFKTFDFSQIETLNGVCDTVLYPKGATIMKENEPASSFLIVLKGEVAIFARGTEIAKRGPGSCIGEPALFHWNELRMSTVIAKTPVIALVLERSEWLALAERETKLGMTVYEQMAGSLKQKLQEELKRNIDELVSLEIDPTRK